MYAFPGLYMPRVGSLITYLVYTTVLFVVWWRQNKIFQFTYGQTVRRSERSSFLQSRNSSAVPANAKSEAKPSDQAQLSLTSRGRRNNMNAIQHKACYAQSVFTKSYSWLES